MKYGIIGVGAIGGYYGSKLAYSGQEVHFLSHSDYQYVKERGMQVDSCDGSFHLDHVNVYQHAEDMPKCDGLPVPQAIAWPSSKCWRLSSASYRSTNNNK